MKNIIGQTLVKNYFKKVILYNKLAHSYIFEGQVGTGRKLVSKEIAKTLLCFDKKKAPCGECRSCHQINASSHPDFIVINKDTKVIKVDTIRDKIINEVNTKPYQSSHKFIVVNDAHTLNSQSQNTLLKTLEDPPSYIIIILIVDNIDKLISTIKSRCIHIRFNNLSDNEIFEYMQLKNLKTEHLNTYIRFCNGSIGTLENILEDETFLEQRKESINYLKILQNCDIIGMYSLIDDILKHKDNICDTLDFWILWYRDLAMMKSIKNPKLYFLDEEMYLKNISNQHTHNKISRDLNMIQKAKIDIEKNLNPLFVMENLFIELKRGIR
ncbi:hypothetical protein AN639_12740 [Candidatus Epulonipiscium fishelsonii]|uniref:Uncharacterized protein n=1 Tax=Candidatus Epulonipiscium fishelsonii TaxID=77094 RepID=A0ACC8XGI9_9FIRM|nr:hypothetical protein AN639_12740 [Epulopiscium sp. SCG-B05WGA-EpuloA1]ONI42711.1 hypothetical protein AN396_13560 [Epulopiscium sp. SCG-B11WGA-EpuloA1]ONI47035.1 hypothetical protein AN644_01920 [Epulopiscium sp. SCG-C06WGA-EpuloA1]